MSSTARDGHRTPTGADRLPEFNLDYLFDDSDDPTEVTVFPADERRDLSTNWITIDVESAVPLDRIR